MQTSLRPLSIYSRKGWRTWVVSLGLVSLLVSSLSLINAQSSVNADALTLITQAVETTQASTSMTITTQTQTEIAGMPDGLAFGQVGSSSFQIIKNSDGDGWNAAGERAIGLTLPNGEIEITTEVVVLEGTVYLRIGELPEQLVALAQQGGQQGQTIPEGWFEVSALAEGQNVPFAGDLTSISETLLGALAFPITAESVTEITELEGATIDEQPMRVFQITLDPQQIIDSDSSALLNVQGGGFGGFSGGQGGFPGGGFPGGARGTLPQVTLPSDLAQVTPPSEPMELNPENFQVTFAVYIGQDDGLVHRIFSVIAVAPSEEQQVGLTITSVTDYTAFGEAVEITAPEIGQ